MLARCSNVGSSANGLKRFSEREKQYRELFENANDALAAFTPEGRITSVNRAMEQMLVDTRSEIIGDHFSKRPTPKAPAEAKERHRRGQAGAKLPSIFESEFVRNDGAIIPVECRARFIRCTTGKVISFQRSYREITDCKHPEATLKREHLFDKFTQADASTTFWFSLRLPISEQIEPDVFPVADLKKCVR